MFFAVFLGLMLVALWIGHACIWTYPLNYLYGSPIPKWFLKPYRLVTGVVIGGGFVALYFIWRDELWNRPPDFHPAFLYAILCLFIGTIVFPLVTLLRLLRKTPLALVAESTRTLDLWPRRGRTLIGDGKWKWLPHMPLNCLFRIDFTDLTLAPAKLPHELDGLTILLLSDLHFHGTPSRQFYDDIFDELVAQPTPDLVVLAGDFLDKDSHLAWVEPILGRLKWNIAGLAILGNHDEHHQPDAVRDELAKLGYRILSNRCESQTIRGIEITVSGHEGPWLPSPPNVKSAPTDRFHLCVSHTPDNVYWGMDHGVNLMLCGHVHGGQIRLPCIGSIFVPSIYSRRFDMGVFELGPTTMVVGRGLSGKEPLRFRCHPQIIRITLTARN